MVRLAVIRGELELPYVEQGDRDGVALLLLHAWPDSRRSFDQLLAGLPERILGRELPEAITNTLCEENLKVPAGGPIPAPTLIVWGACDALLPRADQEVIYDGVGQLPVNEAPERVAADLTALCDAVAAR